MSRGGNLHNDVFNLLRLGHLVEDELFLGSGGLDGHISEFEESLQESVRMHGNVLYPVIVQFGDLAVEESVEASHRKATKEISKLVFSKDISAVEVLKALIANDDALIYHGEGSAKI